MTTGKICPDCGVVIEDSDAGFCGECGATLPIPTSGEDRAAETGEAGAQVWQEKLAEKEREIEEFTKEFEERMREFGAVREQLEEMEKQKGEIEKKLEEKAKETEEFEEAIHMLATSKKDLEVKLKQNDADALRQQLADTQRELDELKLAGGQEEILRLTRLLEAKEQELLEKEKDIEVAILLKNQQLEKKYRERVSSLLRGPSNVGAPPDEGEEEDPGALQRLKREVEFLREENRNLEALMEQLQLVGEETVLQVTTESEAKLKELAKRAENAERRT